MDGEKKSSSSLTGGFHFISFLSFFFPSVHQGVIMGQLDSGSSLCKWHLDAGKQFTNKGARDKLKPPSPLIPSIRDVCLSRHYTLP